jgi:predicted enzyme related to lactoylglutathione lyase
MSTREDYPSGVPCWVDTSQPDPADAARFYSGLFGWQTEDAMPPDAGAHYYMARIDGRDVAAISSQPPGAPPQAMWNTYIRVESADDAAARVREAGGRVLSEPFDVFDAGRMGVFADPEGAVFCVWQPGSHRGSAAVNEHGAVNFNNLHTDDVEAARAFYGAVFGWTTIDAGSPMWALPGYGDHLEELNPGLRAGMKQMRTRGRRGDDLAPRGRPSALERDLRRRRRGRDSCANSEARSSPSRRMRRGCDSLSSPFRLARPSPPAGSWRRTARRSRLRRLPGR